MDGDKITLDRDTFKALAVDTRVKILKILDDRQHTLTDLAEELEMAPSTIKEHLDTLVAAGLIRQVDKGMKWKYYKLTMKGKQIVNPYEKKVWIILASSIAMLGASMYLLLVKLKEITGITIIETFKSSNAITEGLQSASQQGPVLGPADSDTILNTAMNYTPPAPGIEPSTWANDSLIRAAGEAKNTAGDVAQNLSAATGDVKSTADLYTTVSTTIQHAASTVTTTMQGAERGVTEGASSIPAQVNISEMAAHIPYIELAATFIFLLITGFCIGYLIKKKRII